MFSFSRLLVLGPLLFVLEAVARVARAMAAGEDGTNVDEFVPVVFATMCMGWAMLRYAQMLSRAANVRPERDGNKRRKVEERPRGPYAWEEDGYEGMNKVRVQDPAGRPGWAKFLQRDLGSYRANRFRQLFRIPVSMFWDIHDAAVADGWKARGGRGTPIPLGFKMLCFFRIIATGMPMDSFEELAGCSRPCINVFIHEWASWMVRKYEISVLKWPRTMEEIRHCEGVYRELGLPGCIGSTDGVHVASDVVAVNLQGDHCGKERYPTVVFNVTTSHNRRIQNVAGPFPGDESPCIHRCSMPLEIMFTINYLRDNDHIHRCFQ